MVVATSSAADGLGLDEGDELVATLLAQKTVRADVAFQRLEAGRAAEIARAKAVRSAANPNVVGAGSERNAGGADGGDDDAEVVHDRIQVDPSEVEVAPVPLMVKGEYGPYTRLESWYQALMEPAGTAAPTGTVDELAAENRSWTPSREGKAPLRFRGGRYLHHYIGSRNHWQNR